ncbi:glycine oxidase ThiO [Rhizobium helianthi]|uniref:Glycine oxidase ThiO n=1 Tax=Rhizobium helianthi TaxID=1132695 RepID=A0ABW4M6U3_9HYPH
MSILIKGAGVAGLTLAHELHRRGFAITIRERKSAAGLGASHYAGGMLAPWCERESASEAVLQMGLSAANWWDQAVPGLVERKGTLVVAPSRDRGELERFARRTSGFEWLDEAGIAALEPSLSGRFRRALFFAGEAHLDPRLALTKLAETLASSGVRFIHADDPLSAHGFDHVVDCTGAAAIGSLEGLRGVRGEMLMLHAPDVHLSRTVRVLHPRHPVYLVPRGEGRYMLGATMIEANDDAPASARSVMELLNTAYALDPAFGEARILELGAGVRPAFADNMPRVLQTPNGLAIAGLYRHGFLLAPSLARQAADMLDHTMNARRLTA